jgi:hypothetical protein
VQYICWIICLLLRASCYVCGGCILHNWVAYHHTLVNNDCVVVVRNFETYKSALDTPILLLFQDSGWRLAAQSDDQQEAARAECGASSIASKRQQSTSLH